MTAHRDNTSRISDLLTSIRGKSVSPSVRIGSRTWAIKHAHDVIHTPVDKELAVFVVIRTGSKKQSWHRLKDMSSDYLDVLRAADINGASPIGTADQINARRMIRSSLASDCALLKIIYRAWLRSKKARVKSKQGFDFFEVLKKLPATKLNELRQSWENPIQMVLGVAKPDMHNVDLVLPFGSYVEVFIHNVLKIEGLYQDIPTSDTIKRAYISKSAYTSFSKRLHSDAGPKSQLELQIRKTIREGNDTDLTKLFAQVLKTQ
ncbi:MAG: hypothetical protein A2285_05635 [Elusimicrobia bacterium RIFOXYA12_FULL_57_11]|nr:MAG: hypothetical protein A2285_05635 [Elusimicrobia bacterium RIFOXYA12_FULL_57_11]